MRILSLAVGITTVLASTCLAGQGDGGSSASASVGLSGQVISRAEAFRQQPITIAPVRFSIDAHAFALSGKRGLNYSVIKWPISSVSGLNGVQSGIDDEISVSSFGRRHDGVAEVTFVYD